VRFVHDHQVPAGVDKVFKAVAVRRVHLLLRPATAPIQRLDRIHGTDDLIVGVPEVLVACYPFVRGYARGLQELKLLPKVRAHLGNPLRHQPLGRDHENAPDEAAQLQLAQDQPGLDRLAQANLVGQ
jgi:hypothetical protein